MDFKIVSCVFFRRAFKDFRLSGALLDSILFIQMKKTYFSFERPSF